MIWAYKPGPGIASLSSGMGHFVLSPGTSHPCASLNVRPPFSLSTLPHLPYNFPVQALTAKAGVRAAIFLDIGWVIIGQSRFSESFSAIPFTGHHII